MSKTQHNWTKAIVKGGIPDFELCGTSDGIPHIVKAKGIKNAVDANGIPVDNKSIRNGCGYENAALNHYSTKTIEEFVLSKMKRGYPLVCLNPAILNTDYFFNQNEWTKEKEDLYEELTGEVLKKKMKKKLYFYIWVSPDFETNIAVRVHEICLKRYIRIFDEINFVVATDDTRDAWRAVKWADSVCGELKYNMRIVNNVTIRESRVVIEDLLPKIIKKDNEMVFFGHSKAITDVSMEDRNKFSVLRWVISMYYYCFEYLGEAEEMLKENSMYGSLLTHFSTEPNSSYNTHNTFYIGNFFWLNPSICAKNNLFEKIIPNEYNRFLAENMPLLFDSKTLSSHNMAITENTVADLYYQRKEEWPKYLSYYGDSDILYEMQNSIINEVCGEEGC